MTDDNEINFPEQKLEGAFYTSACPVQACGTIDGFEFYFRARHQGWTFAVATDKEGDAVLVESPEQGFFREARYGEGEFDASYMPLSEARAIIARCAGEYLRERT